MHWKQKKANVTPPVNSPYDNLIIIDFEATCQENNLNYNHEIFEYPAVLVDFHTREIVTPLRMLLLSKLYPWFNLTLSVSHSKLSLVAIVYCKVSRYLYSNVKVWSLYWFEMLISNLNFHSYRDQNILYFHLFPELFLNSKQFNKDSNRSRLCF